MESFLYYVYIESSETDLFLSMKFGHRSHPLKFQSRFHVGGNRRGEVNVTSRSNGFDWGASAISTSVWKGASLAWIIQNILGVEFNEEVAGKFFW